MNVSTEASLRRQAALVFVFITVALDMIAHALPGAAWYMGAVLLVAAALPVLREAPDRDRVRRGLVVHDVG